MNDYVLSLSYGKDSLACLGAIEKLGLPLTRIVHAEVWFDENTPADLPPMVEFKKKADEIIKARYGIEVEHYRAKYTFKQGFYLVRGHTGRHAKFSGAIYGWPMRCGQWCLQQLKLPALKACNQEGVISYLGIAADEPKRFHNLNEHKISPLVEAGWRESDAKQWCIENDLLSPIYTDTCLRGGCWFCHNQGVQQLRELRHNYPNLWEELLKLDIDSPVSFRPEGHTVHDFDKRFAAEDNGLLDNAGKRFRWKMLDDLILDGECD